MSTFFPFGIPVTSSYAESSSYARLLDVTVSNVSHSLVAGVGQPGPQGPNATGCPSGYENAFSPSLFTPLPSATPNASGVDRSKYILCFPIPTPSRTATPTASPTPTISVTTTPSRTPTISVTTTPSVSLTPSVSITPTATISTTPSVSISPTTTPTPTISITNSVSVSVTPSISRSPTPSLSISVTATPSVTPSVSPSKTPSVSITRTPSVTPSPTCTVICSSYALGDDDSVSDACTGNNDTQTYFNNCNGLIYRNNTCSTLFTGWIYNGGSSADRYIDGAYVGLTACPSVTPTPTPSITRTPSVTRTPTITPTPTISLTPSISVTPSITPSSSPTYFAFSLTGPDLLEDDACNSITFTTRYSACSTLTTGCVLYNDSALTVTATAGWYATSGGVSYQVTSFPAGEIDTVDSCFS